MSETRALMLGGEGEDSSDTDLAWPPDGAGAPLPMTWKLATGAVAALSAMVATWVAFNHAQSQVSMATPGLMGPELTRLQEDENPCDRYPYLKYEVPGAVVYNNLANKGPDSGNGEGMVYRTIDLGKGAGDELDREVYLTVNATGNYKPFSPRLNGVQGKYGSINLWSGSEVQLHFNFFDRETMRKLTLPEFAITFFDLDTGVGGKSAEYVIIGGYDQMKVRKDTEVKMEMQPDGRMKFMASTVGDGDDNPKDPNFLTPQQENRAVTLLYGPTSNLSFTIGATAGTGPRFFTFVGRPSLYCATTVQENYVPPLEDLTFHPPMEDAIFVEHREKFVSFAVKKGDEVKKGDTICTTQKDGHPPKEYKAKHDGTVTKLQDKLKPGDKMDERLSEKIIAVVERPSVKELPQDKDVVGGGPGKDAGLPSETVFKKYLVKPGDEVQKGDPIAVVEKREGGEKVEVKATDCGIVQERQEELKDGMLLEAVPDKNLITLAPLPSLASGAESSPAATVTKKQAEEEAFMEYKVKKGDIVKKGDVIAIVKDKDGKETAILAQKGGVISDLHEDLKPGTKLARVQDGNLASVGKFPPLPVEPGMSPVGVKGSGKPTPETQEDGDNKPTAEPLSFGAPDGHYPVDPEKAIFEKYYVKPGDVVETGDPIAQVKDQEGVPHDILAPKPGVVKHTQDGLQPGMVLQNVMQDDNLVTLDKLPALQVRPGQKACIAPLDKNWEFKEWKVKEGDAVAEGDPIAVLKNDGSGETMEVKAEHAGTVVSRQEHLKPGDVVEQSTKDSSLATLDCNKGPELGFREVGVEAPSLDCTFVEWKVKEGEKVHSGDPIAEVECPSRRLMAARRLQKMEPFTIPSPGTGHISYMADLKPGQPIKASVANPTIAKVDMGMPWWLLLLAAMCVLCCCFFCLFKAMQKPVVYKAMGEKKPAAAVPKPPPANTTPSPAPAPAPEPEPEGVRLDFEDEEGRKRTVYARYRPLGIHHNKVAPIVAHSFTVNSYARQALGVQSGWKLTRIGKEELHDTPNFELVDGKLERNMRDLPVWPLPLEFRKRPDDVNTQVVLFVSRPLGIEFSNRAPIKVAKIHEGSPAAELKVQLGWFLTRIGDRDVHASHNFRQVLVNLKEGAQGLDDNGKNYPTTDD